MAPEMTDKDFDEIRDRARERAGRVKPGWHDPECPKCGLMLGNRMAYSCPHAYCPSGLNR